MDRGASSAVIAQLEASANEPCHLFELWLDDETVRATDAYRDITWNGNTYIALGSLLGWNQMEESSVLQVTTTLISLSGVQQDDIALLLTNNFIDRRIVIYKAFVSGATVLVDPLEIFDGRCDAPVIEEDPTQNTCTVTLSAAQHWIDFKRLPGRHTNDAEEQVFFPGDKGFEFIPSLANQKIKWGAT